MKLRAGIAGYGVVGKLRRRFIDNNEHMQTVAVCDMAYKSKKIGYFPKIILKTLHLIK